MSTGHTGSAVLAKLPKANIPDAVPVARVLLLDHTASLGGAELALLHLVQAIDPGKCTPVVVLFADGPLVEKLTKAGVETHVLPLSPRVVRSSKDNLGLSSLFRLRDVLETVFYVFRLARFLRAQRAALVHTNSLKADIIGGLAARLARIPLLWHVRDSIVVDYLPRMVVIIFRRLSRILPDFVVANSHATLANLFPPSRPNSRASVVHDGVPAKMLTLEPDLEVEKSSETEAPSTTIRIGLVGRISPWKGQHIFLQAAAKVRQRCPGVFFQIIGSALFQEQDYEQEVRALATSLHLDDCVEFTGFRDDVPALISRLDILVHASTTGEPFGQVITEGMAAGKPVVATAGGGVPEIVVHGQTGLLVPMNAVDPMAEAIFSLLADPAAARRMGRLGRQRVIEHFTVTLTARRIEAVYAQVLGLHTPRPKHR